jgi:tetratricopeptide (TPR) repeat protein
VSEQRRLRVYISSTYQDLVEFRRTVDLTLRQLRYDVTAMETYVAADERPADRCIEDARACDVYVGIFARRYGFIPPGYDQSITELEYRAATDAGRKRLIFLSAEDVEWPPDHVERGSGGEQIARLRAELKLAHSVAFFSSPDELGRVVATAITAEAERRLQAEVEDLKSRQAQADRDRTWERQQVVNLPPTEVSRFLDREADREDLASFLVDEGVCLISVVGRGGMGKSALASFVLSSVEPRETKDTGAVLPRHPDGIVYLSSRSTGLTLERLYTDTRRLLPEDRAETLAEAWVSRDATVDQKAETLREALHGGRYVIMLDGIETALEDDGSLIDGGLRAFVEACLRRSGGPVLVVTSRLELRVPPEGLRFLRTVRLQEGLPVDAAVSLLRDLDPQGDLGLRDADKVALERVAELTSGIPRALELVAAILREDAAATLERLLEDEAALEGNTVESLVAEGYRRLGDDDRRVMQALAVLERPVPHTAVTYLLLPWHPGIDVAACLRRLTRSYFVTAMRRTGEYTLQPLDREHAYDEIAEPDAADLPTTAEYNRRALERRAADFYASIRKPVEQWQSIDDISPQLAEFKHRVRAGDVDGALEVLQLVDEDYLFLWGHYTSLIELRTSVLHEQAQPRLRAANLASLAACQQVLGDYDAAVQYYEEAIAISREACDSGAEIAYAGNLGRVYRNLGEIDKAVHYSQQAYDFYSELGDLPRTAIWADRLALGYWNIGRLDESIDLCSLAVTTARNAGDRRTEAAALSNVGLVYQTQGRDDDAEASFALSLSIVRDIRDRRGEAIALGRLGTAALRANRIGDALRLHSDALAIARALNERREESYQLLGSGRAQAASGDLHDAVASLRAAQELEVPETSYRATLALALTLLRLGDSISAMTCFIDVVRRCEEQLGRCDRLYAARYALAISLAGAGCCAAEPKDGSRRGELLDRAIVEAQRALANCSGHGVVRATLGDVRDIVTMTGGHGTEMDALIPQLEAALGAER